MGDRPGILAEDAGYRESMSVKPRVKMTEFVSDPVM